MKIGNQVYETLTPEQRLVAMVEASGRDDENEMRRLVTSCPRKNYSQPDAAFMDEWEALVSKTLALELDLMHKVINILFFLLRKENKIHMFLADAVADLAAMDEATTRWAETKGISRGSWEKFRPKRHPAAKALLDLCPEVLDDDVRLVQEARAKVGYDR